MVNNKIALVIDDIEFNRISVTTYLTICGFEVDSVENGLEGLKAISQKKYNLIFSDIDMPYMNGLEFLKKIKRSKDYRDIPVIMLSTKDDEDTMNLAKVLGAITYITKPYNREKMKLALSLAGF